MNKSKLISFLGTGVLSLLLLIECGWKKNSSVVLNSPPIPIEISLPSPLDAAVEDLDILPQGKNFLLDQYALDKTPLKDPERKKYFADPSSEYVSPFEHYRSKDLLEDFYHQKIDPIWGVRELSLGAWQKYSKQGEVTKIEVFDLTRDSKVNKVTTTYVGKEHPRYYEYVLIPNSNKFHYLRFDLSIKDTFEDGLNGNEIFNFSEKSPEKTRQFYEAGLNKNLLYVPLSPP